MLCFLKNRIFNLDPNESFKWPKGSKLFFKLSSSHFAYKSNYCWLFADWLLMFCKKLNSYFTITILFTQLPIKKCNACFDKKKVQSYHICNSWLTAKYLAIFCLIKIAKYLIDALKHIMEILFMKTSKKIDDKT